MELNAVELAVVIRHGRNWAVLTGDGGDKAIRDFAHQVTMAHPDSLVGWQIAEQHGVRVGQDINVDVPVLTLGRRFNAAAQFLSHQLHAVAHPENRDAQFKQLRVHAQGTLIVNRVGAAREDNPLWCQGPHLRRTNCVRFKFGINAEVTNPAGNQLVVLATVVEHDNLVVVLILRSCHHVTLLCY